MNCKGFLLGEALIASALLAIGLFAVSNAVGIGQKMRAREARRALLADCAQSRLVATVAQAPMVRAGCEAFTWSEERIILPSGAERTTLRAASTAKGREEDVFETVTAVH